MHHASDRLGLKQVVAIDAHVTGKVISLRVDKHANITGNNGAGKTTLLKLIPLFYGAEPGRVMPRRGVKFTLVEYLLPRKTSLIVYEYTTPQGPVCSVKAAIALMTAFSDAGLPVIHSNDADPAGIDILLRSSATHALVPCHHWLCQQKGSGHKLRAEEQLVRLPGIQERVRNDPMLTDAYKKHALWVLSGRALTEEGLLALEAPMEIVAVRHASGPS